MNWDKKPNYLNQLVTFKRKVLIFEFGLFAVLGFLVAYNVLAV